MNQRRLSSLIAATLVLAGCDGIFGGSGSSDLGGGGDAGVCMKDREALSELLVQPQSCVTTAECPQGSYCDPTLGTCDWECYADSDCGSGYTCSCDGVCLDGGGGGGGSGESDPSCPRDESVLLDLDVSPRGCLYDENCPFGSACDRETGTCTYTCLGTDHPTAGCAAGTVCNCQGECVDPALEDDPSRPASAIMLTVNEHALHFTEAEQSDKTLTITLSTRDPELIDEPEEDPTVTASVGSPFEVVLEDEMGAIIANGPSVTLTGWTFTESDGWWTASQEVIVSVVDPLVDAEAPWPLDINAADIAFARRTVILGDTDEDTSEPLEGAYDGSIVITPHPDAPDALPATIAVEAWVSSTHLMILDPAGALAPGSALGFDWIAGSSTNVELLDTVSPSYEGALVAEVRLAQLPVADGEGGLTGGLLEIDLPTYPVATLEATFDLVRIDDVSAETCSINDDCDEDEFCDDDWSLCIPGSNGDTQEPFGNQLTASLWQSTRNRAAWMTDFAGSNVFGNDLTGRVTGATWAARLLCYDETDNPGSGTLNIEGMSCTGDLDCAYYDADVLAVAGDLACTDGLPPAAVPLAAQRDRGSQLDAAQLARSCMSELQQYPAYPINSEGGVGGTIYDFADAWFGDETTCVSTGHLYPAIAHTLLGSVDAETPETVDSRSAKLGIRLLSQLLDVHSFVGRQAREEARLDAANGILPVDSNGLPLPPLAIEDALEETEATFELILDADVADVLTSIPPDFAQHPDYRFDPRPVAYWTFDPEDMNGNRVFDVVGRHPLWLGSSFTQADGGIVPTPQHASMPSSQEAIAGDMTVSFWMDPRDANSLGSFTDVWTYGDGSSYSYSVGLKWISSLSVELYASHGAPTSGPNYIQFDNSVWEGALYHFVVVRDTTTKTYNAWINGFPVGSFVYQDAPPTVSGIGRLRLAADFADDFAVWDVALTEDQVLALYDLGRNEPGGQPEDDNKVLQQLTANLGTDEHPQPDHFAPTLIEHLAEYLRTVTAHVDDLAAEAYGQCYAGGAAPTRDQALQRYGVATRYGLALEGLARQLYEHESTARPCTANDQCTDLDPSAVCQWDGAAQYCSVGGERILLADPPSADRWQAAIEELGAARRALDKKAGDLRECRNPLGIPDNALPLYFGDVAGENSRFFASSDYLVNTWAAPAVAQAESALEAARSAWLAKRNADIQQTLSEHDAERRVEALETQAANVIIDACGLGEVDPLGVMELFDPAVPGALSASDCYVISSCPQGTTDASCYRGALGAAAITVTSAEKDVALAQAAAADATSRYKHQSLYCQGLEARLEMDNEAFDDHVERMKALHRKQASAGKWGRRLGAFVSSLASRNPGPLLNAGAAEKRDKISTEIAAAELEFQAYLAERSNFEEITRCYHEANMMKFAIDNAIRTIERKMIDVEAAALQYDTLRDTVRQALFEGGVMVERELGRTVPSLRHHYWLDEKRDRFERDFAWAKRLTYLAMLATEYEFQQSLGLREAIVGADSPSDLSDALRILDQERAGRTINGRRPDEMTLVMSLRDDIIQMTSREEETLEGERDWSESRRFGERLMAPELAIYDADGYYLGQGIRFAIREDGALALRCAERLWRVSATIQGDILDADAPAVPVVLMKQNTFASQWCLGKGDGTPYQIGAVQPTANLFSPDVAPGTEGETGSYTAAMMLPWLNVRRNEFYAEAYREGASEELAGRGLYGEYILLFPEQGLLELTSGEDPFPLTRVEDVLLRFDLLSVDDIDF